MDINRVSIKIAGAAGEGVISAGHVCAKMLHRAGLYVVTENERPSLIRGGHNQFMIRAEDEQIYSHINLINILVALNKKSALMHANELSYQGAIIYDIEDFQITPEELDRTDLNLVGVPMQSILKKVGSKIAENALALGAVCGLLNMNLEVYLTVLKEEYGKHPEALKADLIAAQEGYDYVRKNHPTFGTKIEAKPAKRLLMNGLQGFNLGALKAGVKFVAQYPMTPSTGVISGLASVAEKEGIVIIQSEDEIASMNLTIGAAHAGVRALTATSGGGFALMNEALSLAGITETPVVTVMVSRGNPGTGLPTRTEQSDLKFVMNSGHGEFPHIVIAPNGPKTAYIEAQRAFNLAEKYQTPVTLLFDRYAAETFHTFDELPEDLPIERSVMADIKPGHERYPRFDWSTNGVSPRVIPGTPNGLFVGSGNEHDPTGLMNDDREIRTRMMNKRLKKYEGIIKELPAPRIEGGDAPITLVTWGSTKPIIKDAIKFLANDGIKVNHLHITYMQPFHKEVGNILRKCKRPILIENNATAQLGELIAEQTGFIINDKILQYDGWPFAPEQIAQKVKEVIVWQ